MNPRTSFYRKAGYLAALVAILAPLARLGAPATTDSRGGTLAQLRDEYDLGQADLGAIDPASETIRLATLGLRGLAVSMLWSKANGYKKTEDWTAFQATLEQLARLQPYFIQVWRFQSWNLTYNVSVESDDVRDRFYYVKQGIKYLTEGTKYNLQNPTLLADLGWFNGNKVGRADEHEIYRRLYKADKELHPADRTPDQRDNWLVAKEWYQEAIRPVDVGEKSLGTKNPVTFFDGPARSQISYADAIETEGVFGPKARQAWREGGRLWKEFGEREFQATTDQLIRLADADKWRAEGRRLARELNALEPGVEGRLTAEAQQQLTPEQRRALEETPANPDAEYYALREAATEILTITPDKIAAAIAAAEPAQASKARRLAVQIKENSERVRMIDINRDVCNYDYWQVRCDVEQTPEALKAHELAHAARRAFREEADLPGARDLYERSFEQWALAFEKFPALSPDSPTGSDVMDVIKDYAKVLDQMDLRLSDKDVMNRFALWNIVEANDGGRDFADDLEAWQAKNPGGAARRIAAPQDDRADTLLNPADAFAD